MAYEAGRVRVHESPVNEVLTILDTDRDTTGDTVRVYLDGDEKGSTSGVAKGSDLDIPYTVPTERPKAYEGRIVIDDGTNEIPWISFELNVVEF